MGIFDLFKKKKSPAVIPQTETTSTSSFKEMMLEAFDELKKTGAHSWSLKANKSEVFLNQILQLSDKDKVAFIMQAIEEVSKDQKKRKSYSSSDPSWQIANVWAQFMEHLLKTKLVLDDEDICSIYGSFFKNNRYYHSRSILHWPVSSLINQLDRQLKNRVLSDSEKVMLKELSTGLTDTINQYYQKEKVKLKEKVDTILFRVDNIDESVKPSYFHDDDAFGKQANEVLRTVVLEEQRVWFQMMAMCKKSSGGKPSKKFLDEGIALIRELGPDKYKKVVIEWFEFIINDKEIKHEHTYEYNKQQYTSASYEFISAPNIDSLKGFVWLCSNFYDNRTLLTIASLAERCYRKIPGKGPAAAAIGNACFYSLANSKGLDGIGHLSRLKLRIKQSNTLSLIESYLQEAAKSQGVSVHEIEDMAIDDYELKNGEREYLMDGFKALLKITGVGKTEIYWFKPDGSPQKSVPVLIKDKHAPRLKKIKETAKQVELTLTAQRDRLDRMFKNKRELNWQNFDEFYFSHGLVSFLAKRLIWNFHQNTKTVSAIFYKNKWVDPTGGNIITNEKDSMISLWHPVHSSIEEITAWREFMMKNEIIQPLKQAFREVYLLTDAEINTRTYSNRMAAHILKQHQFNSLAKTRGWKYSLLGAYDDGRDNATAEIVIGDYGIKAQYWVNEVNTENAMNDTGIWLYVATDQIRFLSSNSNEVIELIHIPEIVLSEVMRDVDLFVGVASVGNDPNWRDNGGITAYRDYWQSYSFGELTEVAKTRKQILEKLLPRLKISKYAQIKDRFLVVKGKLRTYKIHLGSTNILMEPNDQYLCIVPDRTQKSPTENLFLPFEGDNGLSIILSKALLLAEDDQIADQTIRRQIKM